MMTSAVTAPQASFNVTTLPVPLYSRSRRSQSWSMRCWTNHDKLLIDFFGKVGIQRHSPTSVKFMLNGRLHRSWSTKSVYPFGHLFKGCARGVGDIDEVGVWDMNLIWVDSNDRTWRRTRNQRDVASQIFSYWRTFTYHIFRAIFEAER